MTHIRQMPLSECLKIITQYQKTDDSKLFLRLLAQFDNLLLHTIQKIRKYDHTIQREEMQELYHIAIVGMSNALKKIPPDEKPKMIPAWIVAYVKAALKKTYRYKNKEETMTLFDVADEESWMHYKRYAYVMRNMCSDGKDIELKSIASDLMNSELLESDEREYINRHVLEGETFRSIAESENMSTSKVFNRVKAGLDKLRKLLEDGSIDSIDSI